MIRTSRFPRRSASRAMAPLAAALATLLALPVNAAIDVPRVPPGSGNGVPPNIMFILDDSGSMSYPTMPAARRSSSLRDNITDRSYVHNTVYYNPAIDYQPWMQADGTRMSGGTSYTRAYADAAYASDTIDLRDDDDCGTSRENDSNVRLCGGDQIFYVPEDPSRTDAAYLSNSKNYYKFVIDDDGEIRRSADGGKGSWTRATPDMSKLPDGRAPRSEADERANYATWFSYHRTRLKAAKAGASEAFSGLVADRYRVGFRTIWNRDELRIPVTSDNGLFRGDNREDWFDKLFAARSSGNTPLKAALDDAGKYFSESKSSGPYGGYRNPDGSQFACRQNFAILTSDGYWNHAAPSVGNADNQSGSLIKAPANPDGTPGRSFKYEPQAPYADGHASTLADVAMKYWKSDLRDNLPNIVPVSGVNPAFWQHMVTFGISIGLSGTTGFSSVEDVPADFDRWPDPTDREDADRIDDLLHAAVNGRGQFVAAANPAAFAQGLKDALGAIGDRTSSSSNVSASSTSVNDSTRLFQARYVSGEWSGEVSAFPVTDAGIGSTPLWRASNQIPAWASRRIFTTDHEGNRGRFPTRAQEDVLGEQVTDYLRGDASRERTNGGNFRTRARLLGDVIHSSPYYVRPTDSLYVGANDGMLHAFDGTSGRELFAYIPRGVTAAALGELASPNYSHRYYVDGPVVVADRSITVSDEHPAGRDILFGTLGRGGKGVFALDVTDPGGFDAGDVLVDIAGGADMGLVTGEPLIARLNDGSLGAVFGNGINSDNGRAVLWVVNLDSGATTRIDTGAGGDNGLSAPRGWDEDGNGTVDLIYAGDQAGNLWKFDLSDKNTKKWEVANTGKPMFIATDAAGNRQPISGRVSLGIDPSSYQRWVLFGTGRMLNDDDLWESDGEPALRVQTMYGLIDGNDAIGTRAANDDPGAKNGLVKRTIAAVGFATNGTPIRGFEADTAPLPAGKRGWFVDLVSPPDGTPEGERIIGDAQLIAGVLVTSSIIPSQDPCSPGGRGYLNAINAFTGGSVGEHFFDVDGDGEFTDDEIGEDGVPVGSVDLDVGMPTDGELIDQLIGIGGSSGSTGSVAVKNPAGPGRISWREIVR